jgi:hypothetical protein
VPVHECSIRQGAFEVPSGGISLGGVIYVVLMARFTKGSGGRCRVDYTMSTGNPYQVVIMRTDLKLQAKAK